jgi:hypothetical protein
MASRFSSPFHGIKAETTPTRPIDARSAKPDRMIHMVLSPDQRHRTKAHVGEIGAVYILVEEFDRV